MSGGAQEWNRRPLLLQTYVVLAWVFEQAEYCDKTSYIVPDYEWQKEPVAELAISGTGNVFVTVKICADALMLILLI